MSPERRHTTATRASDGRGATRYLHAPPLLVIAMPMNNPVTMLPTSTPPSITLPISGIDATIVGLIDMIDYWFYAEHGGERRRYHKFVHFYLMRSLGGDVGNHDHEVVESRWVTVNEALEMLYFKTERDVVTKAVTMIGN